MPYSNQLKAHICTFLEFHGNLVLVHGLQLPISPWAGTWPARILPQCSKQPGHAAGLCVPAVPANHAQYRAQASLQTES